MRAAISKVFQGASEAFWIVPAAMVVGGFVLGEVLVRVDRSGLVSQWVEVGWLYSGGESGARTLLGAVASSTIGVAGTVFSITIAALAFAASQMGPRLLSNFTRDRGNQVTLGLFLGTFAFALTVLRAVRSAEEVVFVPHLAVSVAIVLALACVAMLVYFVHHMASRINVDTVVELVHEDFRAAIKRLTLSTPDVDAPLQEWQAADFVAAKHHGYLQQFDEQSLAKWAAGRGVRLRLLVRPGDFIFPGARLIEASAVTQGLGAALYSAMAIGRHGVGSADLEFSVRQLVDVAVRALSPGINDPQTAISVVNRLGAALCELSSRFMPTGATVVDDVVVLVRPVVDYEGICAAMFHPIRQNATDSAVLLIRLIEVLTEVARIEKAPQRLKVLLQHADLVLAAGKTRLSEPSALRELEHRHRVCLAVASAVPSG